ncbi:MAG: tRNA pseudouridine(55) synthase TruB [Bifidobacterium thermacidophilum]|jgi:tRNA pseudouridine55 synthase|uniref:tRNA pseudouridine(55) synthase TruB n=1 Tax=Bifidobacterium thermacidophilum TaxID=246618 RepID=UPI002F3551DA
MPDGLIVIDKPQRVTSHDVVAAVRSVLHVKRVGHAGTLDPMATGVLVIGFGYATRLLNYIVDHHKTYEATIRLGLRTTTEDAEGEIIEWPAEEREHVRAQIAALSREVIEQAINTHLMGEISQVPSSYSAVKINGKHAYDLAREGKEVALEPRQVTIDSFDVLAVHEPDAAQGTRDIDVRVTCSAGTYIRALGRDLGHILGVGGYLTRLRRTHVGAFSLEGPHVLPARSEEHSFTTRDGRHESRMRARLDTTQEQLLGASLTMGQAARMTMPVVDIDDRQAQDLRYGRSIDVAVNTATAAIAHPADGDDDLVAIIIADSGTPTRSHPTVVFPAA